MDEIYELISNTNMTYICHKCDTIYGEMSYCPRCKEPAYYYCCFGEHYTVEEIAEKVFRKCKAMEEQGEWTTEYEGYYYDCDEVCDKFCEFMKRC